MDPPSSWKGEEEDDGNKSSENDRSISFIIDDDDDDEEDVDRYNVEMDEEVTSPGLPRPDESAFASSQPSRWNQVQSAGPNKELGKRKMPMPPSPSPAPVYKAQARVLSYTPAPPFLSSSSSSSSTAAATAMGSFSVHQPHHYAAHPHHSVPSFNPELFRQCATPDPGSSKYEYEYEEEACIGSGSFGEVFRVRGRRDQQLYAIKKSKPFTGKADKKSKMKEASTMNKLKHPHCVKFVDAWEERASLYIQTELCELGSLKDFMYKHGPLSEDQIWSFLTDMLLGVRHIHDQNLLHLDIKPSNMLLVCLECRRQFIGDGRARSRA